MNNVKDLNMTDIVKTPPTQTVSLDAVKRPVQQNVSINTTNGLSGVETQDNSNNIRINPNFRKRPRRTIDATSEIQQINPNDYIKKETKDEPSFIKTVQSNAMSQLDATVRRKQQEFQDFIKYAEEADKTNREKIDNGLEKIEGEVNYMPIDYPQDTQNASNNENVENDVKYDNNAYEEDDVEKDLEMDLKDTNTIDDNINISAKINSNPFETESYFANQYDIKEEKSFANDNDGYFDDDDDDYAEEEDDEILVDGTINDYKNDHYREDQIFNEEENKLESNNNEEFAKMDTKDIASEEEKPVKKEEKQVNILEKKDEEIRNSLMDRAISVSSTVTYDTEVTKDTISNSSSSDFDIDEEDFDDVNSTEDAAQTEEDAVQLSPEEIEEIRIAGEKNLKNEILKKIINTGKKLDTSQFVISKKIIPIKDALKNRVTEITRTAKWPMMYSERPFIASALKGPEIALLFDYDDSGSESSIGITQQQLKIMYEHDANEYKPTTIENWAKTIPFLDIESIFAALYLASMKGSNYLPMTCREQKCQHQFLTDNIDIDKIVKFNNDDIKNKFNEIMNTTITADNTAKYDSVVNVINDDFAIGLKIPSIFTMVYELNSVDRPFLEKYNTIISIIQYIDYIYKINHDTMNFEPIGWKAYVGNYGKTFKSKIATYAKILKDFDSKEFSVLIALINSMLTKATETRMVEYEIPAGKCVKCGAEIPAMPLAPRQLLFMQQRLVELATTPTERS